MVTTTGSKAQEPQHEWRVRFQRGEPAAVDGLVDRFFHDVTRFATGLLGDPELAMEAVQETFLRVIERHRLYQPDLPFRPWLFRLCRNCCVDLLRTQNRSASRIVDLDPEDREIEGLVAETPRAVEEVLRRECERDVAVALEGLQEIQRSVVLLHLFEDLPFREVARILERPQNTVAAIYYRTLRDLRPSLKEWNDGRANGRRNHGT